MDIISAYREVSSNASSTNSKPTKPVKVRAAREHNYDMVTDLVTERVEKSQGRISAKRMLPIARKAGYEGSERNFRRLVAEAKALWRTDHHRGRRPAVWAPGDYLVIDGATIGGQHLFCTVMAYSRWRFVAFAADEKATTTMALIAKTFHSVGGVPAKVLADRMACLNGGAVANIVIPTPDYVRFAAHYGFAPDFCHAQDPQSKGVVENLVGYAQRDLAVPLFNEAKIAGATIDLPAANAAAKAWCVEVNARVHSEICAIPDEQLDTERELLAPLPSLRLEIGTPPVTRIVDRLSCVRFASARYSVPTTFIGTSVIVRQINGQLVIVEQSTGEIVAEIVSWRPPELRR